jgi:glucosamine 6-phosphate synthetase-like amidotransferase/phosphosugar isomerase protein
MGQETTLSICNVPERRSRAPARSFYTRAGAEIGVASTKAFTTQLARLFTLPLRRLRRARRCTRGAERGSSAASRPGQRAARLNLEPQITAGRRFAAAPNHALFLGAPALPVALEGALKLKEISTSTPWLIPPGELKHGPSPVVDASMPVVFIAPKRCLLEKVKSNMQGGPRPAAGNSCIRRPRQPLRRERRRARDQDPAPRRVALSDRARDPGAASRLSRGDEAREPTSTSPATSQGRDVE